jgi:hypothetical protein
MREQRNFSRSERTPAAGQPRGGHLPGESRRVSSVVHGAKAPDLHSDLISLVRERVLRSQRDPF